MRRVFRDHGLSIVMLGLFFLTFLVGQVVSGRGEYNDERKKQGQPQVGYAEYLASPHFGEATAENWESEFFQMFIFIVATAFLYQKGSAESKDPREKHDHKSTQPPRPDSPWPVRRGGWVLRLYEHSLSLAFFLLFAAALAWHARAGCSLYNEERQQDGEPAVSLGEYLGSSRFWFESFQNWQSEFLSIGAMVVLTIWLREKKFTRVERGRDPALGKRRIAAGPACFARWSGNRARVAGSMAGSGQPSCPGKKVEAGPGGLVQTSPPCFSAAAAAPLPARATGPGGEHRGEAQPDLEGAKAPPIFPVRKLLLAYSQCAGELPLGPRTAQHANSHGQGIMFAGGGHRAIQQT